MRFIRDTLRLAGSAAAPATLCSRLHCGRWAIELGANPPVSHKPDLLLGDAPACAGIAVSLRSASVLKIDLAQALMGRAACAGCHVSRCATLAVHELILNAAIHGNLAVSSGQSACWADLADRHRLMKDALADPSVAGRAVTVALCWTAGQLRVAIADEGDGYQQAVPPPRPAGSLRAAGNGLRIARAAGEVTVSAGGRRTTLVVQRLATAEAG